MDDEQPTTGQVTRLGPDSGGRAPAEGVPTGQPTVYYREWEWSSDSTGRPGLPFVAVLLVALGVLLLLQNLVPGVSVWSWLGVGIGAAALVVWLSRRHAPGNGFFLYAGVVFLAMGLPGVLVALGVLPESDGWSTLFLGVALVVLGLTRRTRGIPFSVWLGGLLAIIGLAETSILPDLGDWLLPLILIGIGVILLGRSLLGRPAT
jgi:hypothetical protein